MMADDHEKRIVDLEQILDKKTFTTHAIWKTNISRDVAELQALLSRENIRDWDGWRAEINAKVKVLLQNAQRDQP